jgi:DNA-binding transcriptional LysR family regulator
MELMQLQMLVAVAEEGALQKAAERVYRTGPAVSMAIDKLEKELDVSLIERSPGRDLRLIAAGSLLVDYAKRLLTLRDEALMAVEELRSVKQGTLRIGANQSIGEYLLPRLTNAFHRQHPEIRVKIMIGYSDAMLGALRRREIDIALVASRPEDGDFRQQLLMPDRLVAVLPAGHRLANSNSIDIHALGKEPLVLLSATSELRDRIERTFERFDIAMDVQVETASLESIKKMVAQGLGVGIVPRVCVLAEEKSGELVVRPVNQFHEERSLWVATRSAPPPACESFCRIILAELASLHSGDSATDVSIKS